MKNSKIPGILDIGLAGGATVTLIEDCSNRWVDI